MVTAEWKIENYDSVILLLVVGCLHLVDLELHEEDSLVQLVLGDQDTQVAYHVQAFSHPPYLAQAS